MGKLQEFDITFANNKVVYSPGESISGTVKIRISNSLQYKAIKVNCKGSCGISPKVTEDSWTLEEQYLNSTLSIANKGTLAAGEHNFPFQFLIPAAAPTSFEGPFGKIVYRVRAAIDTPRFAKDYKAQRPFYLLNLLNLNEVPDIDHLNYAVATKKFNYLLVKSGTLMLKARTDLRGYIPGQVIRLATEIHNKSGKDTACVLASLIQKATYKTNRPVFDLRTIAEVEGAGVKAGKHAEWREQIIVPPLPQSGLAGCSLIDIDYFIQVSLKSPEAVVTLPIYIGNIAVNLSPDGTVPSSPDHYGLAAAPNTAGVTPSAPPVEDDVDLCAGGAASDEIPTKRHSQQDPSGQTVTMSPSAFSHAPGAALPPSHRHPGAPAPLFCVSTGTTIPFFTEGDPTPMPTSCSLILPPEYSSWDYPHEPPPTYEESCSSTNFSFNSRQ
uniref:arrestin domain-containing protein 1b n=1 Tax=Doryrhamphus excisus TaxID=161450 RepID=UPI0025AE96F7|nr:arrestin domain-containing protein 1b [Doryrhamphus excisus]XP_057920123.1 arrestin domain-containing protein 1b [Doryrhamphus excisus]XP_057920124.1 arrestin domain-containing protein 1b [Doryrhamphus excisus]XP_057920126.1 arrestin domain-containing protein 1b [Doryrhamphus excisus]XP_057920127.1 arrestin domain-containing protein 1b [Doryrhamphus excisus]